MYKITIIKKSEGKHPMGLDNDRTLFDAYMNSDETIEILNRLWHLKEENDKAQRERLNKVN